MQAILTMLFWLALITVVTMAIGYVLIKLASSCERGRIAAYIIGFIIFANIAYFVAT